MALKFRYKLERRKGPGAVGVANSIESLKHFHFEDGDKLTVEVTEK
jgi:hypothetical protein